VKDLATDIMRKRLIIEGYFTVEVDPKVIENFFDSLCQSLSLRKYGKPTIFSPGGEGERRESGI